MEGLSVPVAGPSVIFPRGYLWIVLIWLAAACTALVAATRWPLWVRADAAGGLCIATVTFLSAVSGLTFRAFTVDRAGIRLGLPASTKRRGRHRRTVRQISWQQIERVRVASRPYGVRIEVILGPNATRGYQPHPAVALINRALLLIPFWYLVVPTGLITPLDGPARYRAKLRGVTVDQMRRALRTLAPPEVAIAVLVRRRQSVSSARAASERAA